MLTESATLEELNRRSETAGPKSAIPTVGRPAAKPTPLDLLA